MISLILPKDRNITNRCLKILVEMQMQLDNNL
nr:MAG TPA: hypothetical protein [Caudoviricetes sp.]